MSIVFGAVAALFWMLSALVPMPKGPIRVKVVNVIDLIGVGGSKEGDALLAAIARQSALSAIGAVAASVAAAAQVFSAMLFG